MSPTGHKVDGGGSMVVAAASFGGIAALSLLLDRLPPSFPSPVVVVQHLASRADYLARILAARCDLPVVVPTVGECPQPATVYLVAAGGQTLLAADGTFTVEASARCRADPLFASCAEYHRERLIAIVLTGRLDDGAAGVRTVKEHGGRVLVQDRESAAAFEMPLAAIATGCVDFVLPPQGIAAALVALLMVPGAGELFRVRPTPGRSLRDYPYGSRVAACE